MKIDEGSVVLVHFFNPTEKFWGVLLELSATGVVLRGLNVASFEDWVVESATEGDGSLGLSTMFVPLLRVERIFLDQPSGGAESYQQRFERRVGVPLGAFLDMEP